MLTIEVCIYKAEGQFKDSVMNACICNIRWNHIY